MFKNYKVFLKLPLCIQLIGPTKKSILLIQPASDAVKDILDLFGRTGFLWYLEYKR